VGRYGALVLTVLGLAVSARTTLAAESVVTGRVEEGSSRARPLYLRTVLEELGFLGMQTAWYWAHAHGSNQGESFQTRFLGDEDLVLDDDRFRAGGVGHPIAGTGYYLIARGNGFGVIGSALATVLASATWQFFSEWNEKVATNDLLVTPAAGWVIGEASYQVGQYFLDRGPGLIDCVGAVLFSPIAAMNDARACRLGENQKYHRGDQRRWHRFDLEVGSQRSVFGAGQMVSQLELAADARITSHRFYQRPGAGNNLAGPGQWTTLETSWLIGNDAEQGAQFHADSIAVGQYRRHYRESPDNGLPDGWGSLLALGSSFNYGSRAIPVRWDRVMSVGLVGPMFELTASESPFELRVRAAAYYGFAQVTSLAYPQVASTLSNEVIQTVLREQGYYYAQAFLPSAEMEARYGQFQLKLMGRAGEFWSINADHIHQETFTDTFKLRDARLFTAAAVAFRPFCGPIRVVLEYANSFWSSSLLGKTVTEREQTVGGSIVLGL